MACFIVAEAGVNHNGSVELAFKLVEAAAKAGADAIKFQTYTAEKLVSRDAETAAYQKRQTGEGRQLSLLRQLELSAAVHGELFERSAELGIEFMSTPFDRESADMLVGLGVRRIKVSSGELTNLPFLEFLARKHVPLIVSTGMASLDEVGESVSVIRRVWTTTRLAKPLGEMLTLLHCTSNYPAAFDDVNLRAMHTLATNFDVPVGYSDHTPGIVVPIAAVAMGAAVVEKHLTLGRSLPGPDHEASLEPIEFCDMVRSIRAVEASFGSGEKVPRLNELPIRELVRRSVTSNRPLKAGRVITVDDVTLLRPGNGIAPRDLHRVVGMHVLHDLPAGKTLLWSDIRE